MKPGSRHNKRRVCVLALAGLLICGMAWFTTHGFETSTPRGVVTVEVLKERRTAHGSGAVRLTNTGKAPVEILGVLMEMKADGPDSGWIQTANIGIRTNVTPNGIQDITVPVFSTNHVYRARVSYWMETRGLRLIQRRVKQAFKTGQINVLWSQSKPQYWVEGTSDELRP